MAASVRRLRWIPAALAGASALLALVLGWTAPGVQADNALQDFLLRLSPPPEGPGRAAILAFDDRTLLETGGVRGLRRTLASVLESLKAAPPAVVAVDLTLADAGDPDEDARLAQAFASTRSLVLAAEMLQDGSGWQDPLPRFRDSASGVGHVNALPDPYDKINRAIALERVAGRQVRWALSLEAYRVAEGVPRVVGSPTDVTVGKLRVPSRWDQGRPLRIRFRPPGAIPQVSVLEVLREPAKATALAGRVVFVGVTAQSAVVDRLAVPVSADLPMPGVEIHAQAFESLAAGDFLLDAPGWLNLLLPFLLAAVPAFALVWLLGWRAWVAAGAALAAAHLLPAWTFRAGVVLPGFAPALAAWLSSLACGLWRFLLVRRLLSESEETRLRYQQAFHFLAHEMRTPLTAIQGSSELMTRYSLPEAKRQEIGRMINAESKRLAKMITTFLDVEKLSAGQMELRKARCDLNQVAAVCLDRARPLAERKQIHLRLSPLEDAWLEADQELLEYAVYNLVTNAIKYSPPGTGVEIAPQRHDSSLRLAVRDQGMGMDEKEVKQLFTRFYRTRGAVASGETGTGIGLSIVKQIVELHGGQVEVQSRPGAGSCFTIVLPATLH